MNYRVPKSPRCLITTVMYLKLGVLADLQRYVRPVKVFIQEVQGPKLGTHVTALSGQQGTSTSTFQELGRK